MMVCRRARAPLLCLHSEPGLRPYARADRGQFIHQVYHLNSMDPPARNLTPLYVLYCSPETLSWSTLSPEYVCGCISYVALRALPIRGLGSL